MCKVLFGLIGSKESSSFEFEGGYQSEHI